MYDPHVEKYRRPIIDARKIDWRAALTLHDAGWTFARIAKQYGCNYRTVWIHLTALGAKRRPSPAWHSIEGRRIYVAWQSMRARCNSPSHPSYRHYGGRGVGISITWDEFQPFHDWALRTGYEIGQGLILVNRARDYGPENCRWGGKKELEQERASRTGPRRSSCMVTAFGEVRNITEWARDPRCKISSANLARRLRQGVAAEIAMTSPPRTRWDAPLAKARKPALAKPTARFSIDWDRAIRMHQVDGMSATKIASKLGAATSSIFAGLKKRKALRPSIHANTPDRHRLSTLWHSLMARTTKKRHSLYATNGAIGVRVCREWQDFEVFMKWALESGGQPNMCISRIVRRGPFSPKNCRWITRSENAKKEMRRRWGRLRV